MEGLAGLASKAVSFFLPNVSSSLVAALAHFMSLSLQLPLFLPLLLLFQIKWTKCLIGKAHNRCLITVDGTDFHIQEPFPFSREWFLQKFTGAGVRYGVVVCIQTGEIVWFNDPFPCSLMPDIRILG